MNWTDFHFIRPYWLLALIPAALLLILILRNKLNHGNWQAVCDSELLPYLLQEKTGNVKNSFFSPLTTGATSALLLIIALAGPTWQRLPAPVFRNESALVIALDLSRSMDAADIKPSRLILARYKIADMLKQRKDGLTALLVYAGDAFVVTPLTNDTETIDSQLSALTTEIMPSQGSHTLLALEKAVELFKQAGLQKGRIVLVTDGVDPDKTAEYVARIARDNYTLSILGVGTADGAPIALPDGGFLKDGQGTIVIPQLNTGDLIKLAQAGGGIYQTITANDADIQTLLSSLDKPAPQQGTEDSELLMEQWDDKGPWLLAAALPLAALMFRKGLLCLALLLLLPLPKNSYALEWRDLWQTRDQQAQQAYRQKQYDKAAKLFENPDWKAAAQYKSDQEDLANMKTPKTATGFYNQGNVLAKSQRYEEAIKAYEKALNVNSKEIHPNAELEADAKYNKELVEKELEKQKQQQQQEQQDDKQQSGDKSQQDQEQQGKKSGQSDNGQKPEQKPERSSEERPDEQQQQNEQESAEKKQQQSKPERQESSADNRQTQQNKDKARPSEQQGKDEAVKEERSDEQKQANEQWLKRIPDDPAGLLKRKFKYQYGQRQHQGNDNDEAW